MKMSELIAKLEAARQRHGDLPVFTWDGDIANVKVCPSVDGVMTRVGGTPSEPNELVIEILNAV